LEAVSELIAQSSDYTCKPQDQKELQSWMHKWVSSYAGAADKRIARVIAAEKSIGLDDAGDEMWEA
jgi:hypothetical protein